MKLHKMKTRKTKSYITIKQRITAAFMVVVLLLQICVPTVALAATAWGSQAEFNRQIQLQLESGLFSPVENASADEAYKGAFYLYQDAQPTKNLLNFYREYNGVSDSPVIKQVGDTFVQTRLIRSQIKALLGRFLIQETIAPLTVYAAEAEKINQLYANGLTYGGTGAGKIPLGTPLAEGIFVTTDMIWPEVRTINNKTVLIPVVYLSQTTLDKKIADHNINFFGDTEFAGITIDKNVLLNGYNNTITGINGIINSGGKIQSTGDLTLSSSGTIANLGGVFSATENLKIVAEDFYNKTLVVSYKDKNGEGTRIGSVANIEAGNIQIFADGNIEFIGASAVSEGTFFLNAANDINVVPVINQNNSQSQQGHWEVNKSTTDLLMSRLVAEDTLSLIAGGVINITASELLSTRGGIELLAKNGIHILDELERTSVQREDRKGKTKGTSSEFRTEAVRAILNAGKGVLLDSEHGDVVLRATQLTSTSGTEVYARNGKVHLLMTKELEEFHLQTTRKGSWTIKTRTEDVVHENNIQNAIVGGLQVQAKYGINVEYTGKEGATLKEQIEEYRKMPAMKWMAELYDQAVAEGGQNVNWEVIEEVHKELRKSKSSLSPAAMAIIAIAVCVAMGPAGFGALGGISGAVGGGTFGAAMSAGALTLTTQAAQSLASGNNLRETVSGFDSSDSLKSLAISMVTAGVMQHTDLKMFDVAKTDSLGLSLAKQAGQTVVDSTVRAGISVTINGGSSADYLNSFKTNLASGAVEILGERMANKIGAAYNEGNGSITNTMRYIAHAGAGCVYGMASAAASGADGNEKYSCFSGAGGAVIGELVADQFKDHHQIAAKQKATEEWLEDLGISEENNIAYGQLSDTQKRIMKETMPANFISAAQLNDLRKAGVDLAKLGAGLAAFVAKADVDIAASAGANAAEHNAFPLVIYGALLALSALEVYLKVEETLDLGEKLSDPAISAEEKNKLLIEYAKGWGIDIALHVAGVGAVKAVGKLIEKMRAAGASDDVIAELERVGESLDKGENFNVDNQKIITNGDQLNLPVKGDQLSTFKPKVDVSNDLTLSPMGDGALMLSIGSPVHHGIEVFVDKNGVFGFKIASSSTMTNLYGSGQDMLWSAMNRLQKEGVQINKIRGNWEPGEAHESVNFNAFYDALSKGGVSEHKAAFNTWTGKRAQEYGFNKIESIEKYGESVIVIFGKN
jgi:filamentous hemagglutinin